MTSVILNDNPPAIKNTDMHISSTDSLKIIQINNVWHKMTVKSSFDRNHFHHTDNNFYSHYYQIILFYNIVCSCFLTRTKLINHKMCMPTHQQLVLSMESNVCNVLMHDVRFIRWNVNNRSRAKIHIGNKVTGRRMPHSSV